MRLAYLLLTSALASACATADDPELDEIEVAEDDADSELRVRTGDTTIWMTKDLARRETAGGPMFVLRGRASRNIMTA